MEHIDICSIMRYITQFPVALRELFAMGVGVWQALERGWWPSPAAESSSQDNHLRWGTSSPGFPVSGSSNWRWRFWAFRTQARAHSSVS